ncbi:hypothetical protein GCM10020295_16680 [Streptomyces cinereospinus]
MTTATEEFRSARDFLLEHREDHDTAYAGFRRPRTEYFDWALDRSDVVAAGNGRTALHIVEEDGNRHPALPRRAGGPLGPLGPGGQLAAGP